MASYMQTSRNTLHHAYRLRALARSTSCSRSFYTTAQLRNEARPNEKDEMYVDSTEYSKSGYDGQAAQTDETAFTKGKTGPDEQLEHAEKESKKLGQRSNPLNVSPANREVSRASQRYPGDESKQTKVSGQESRKTDPAKHNRLRRYGNPQDGPSEGTGSVPTRKDEKPGPKFAGMTKR